MKAIEGIGSLFKDQNIDMVNAATDPKKQTGALLKAKGIGSMMLNMQVGKRIILNSVQLCAEC